MSNHEVVEAVRRLLGALYKRDNEMEQKIEKLRLAIENVSVLAESTRCAPDNTSTDTQWDRIKRLRNLKGYTQVQLKEECDKVLVEYDQTWDFPSISIADIGFIENGRVHRANNGVIYKPDQARMNFLETLLEGLPININNKKAISC